MPAPPGTPQTLSTSPIGRTGLSLTSGIYGPPYPGVTAEKIAAAESDFQTPWRVLATAVGVTSPTHINGAHRSIRALARYGG